MWVRVPARAAEPETDRRPRTQHKVLEELIDKCVLGIFDVDIYSGFPVIFIRLNAVYARVLESLNGGYFYFQNTGQRLMDWFRHS